MLISVVNQIAPRGDILSTFPAITFFRKGRKSRVSRLEILTLHLQFSTVLRARARNKVRVRAHYESQSPRAVHFRHVLIEKRRERGNARARAPATRTRYALSHLRSRNLFSEGARELNDLVCERASGSTATGHLARGKEGQLVDLPRGTRGRVH